MIEGLLSIEPQSPLAHLSQQSEQIEQSGLLHSKTAGRYEVVIELPKEAKTFDEMFDYADFYGKFRLAYLDASYEMHDTLEEKRKYATSAGGEFGFKTAKYNGIHINGAVYISQYLQALNPTYDKRNEELFSEDLSSFSYVGELSINYETEYLKAALGRIRIETPYANSDDIRMAANSFEGACLDVVYMPGLHSQFLYLTRWAGYDSQNIEEQHYQDSFKHLVDEKSFGMVSASLTYDYTNDDHFDIWINYIDRMSVITYLEASGITYIDGDWVHFDYGAQYAYIDERNESNIEGSIFGLMGILHLDELFLGAAANFVYVDKGKYVTDGFGGGPYYTSLDEATLAWMSGLHPGEDIQSYKLGFGYDFRGSALEGLIVELVYGKLSDDHNKAHEENMVFTYEKDERWHVEAIFTHFEPTRLQQGFDRGIVRLDYNF